ncbi:Flp pilus assembly protein TadG [Arthrobacter sp. CAN_A214]|uniref:TadE/TadG family type IV pilus assembly protein n=1 Tax=Arthrobacter sp. CAN_A214 TaxID=2787720 RepID=UPI0018CA1020
MGGSKERGAVAVEFAVLLPVLILVLLGIMEFGRAFNVQTSLTSAAREGARVMAITKDATDARQKAINAAVSLDPLPTNVSVAPCGSSSIGQQTTVTITYELNSLTGIAGPFTMTGRGVMLCGG